MPWTPNDAERYTKKADTSHLRSIWASAANKHLAETGDDGAAVRIANAAVNRARRGKGD